MKIVEFLKKHTTIRTKAILLVYVIIIIYKFCYSLFQFSIVRFLKGGVGEEIFLIGLMLAFSNFIGIFVDIPSGIMQKYFRPRIFLLISVGLLLVSDLIFLFSETTLWLGFAAVFFYQMSIEVFFITITTYILRLSTKDDYAQNLAQEDMADNIGDILGLGLGGIIFVIDRFFAAHNMFAASFLGILILLALIFIFEFVDREHHFSLENYILNMKGTKTIIEKASEVGDIISQNPDLPQKLESTNKGGFTAKEVLQGFKTTFSNLFDVLTNRLRTPLLLWSIIILIVTYFWYVSINFFEPFFIKDIFQEGSGWIVDNIPKFIFESIMFIIALLIPTFIFELPFGKLADEWGKEKMVITGTLFSGLAILFLGITQSAGFIFLMFIGISIGFVMIYPSLIGVLGEEYKKAMIIKSKEEKTTMIGESQEKQVEGESAGIISIIINIGEIAAGLIGGFFLGIFTYTTTYIIYGIFLLFIGVGSILSFKYLFPHYNKEDLISHASTELPQK